MSEPSVNVGQELASRLKALNDRLEAEAARLRLTDAEREVLLTVRDIYASGDDSCVRIADAIDGLLARTGGAE